MNADAGVGARWGGGSALIHCQKTVKNLYFQEYIDVSS